LLSSSSHFDFFVPSTAAMGAGASAKKHEKVEEFEDKFADLPAGKRKELMEMFEAKIQQAHDEAPDFCIVKIGSKGNVNFREYKNGKETREKFDIAKEKKLPCVVIREGKVWERDGEYMINKGEEGSKIPFTTCFLIGFAHGKGKCDELGPLVDPEKKWLCLFEKEEDEEEEKDEEGEGEEEAEEGDGKFCVFTTRKKAPCFVVREYEKWKLAKGLFDRKVKREEMVLFTNKKGEIALSGKGWTKPEGDLMKKRQLGFLFGVALGKGAIQPEHLGPLIEEDGPMSILDQTFDLNEEKS